MMTPEDELKQIPYGEANFNDFKVKNLYYVDKTRFIRDIEEKGDFLFLIRPRRFGKSLFLGILEAYYDVEYKDRFDDLFAGTDIHRSPTKEKNSYMVFFCLYWNWTDRIKIEYNIPFQRGIFFACPLLFPAWMRNFKKPLAKRH